MQQSFKKGSQLSASLVSRRPRRGLELVGALRRSTAAGARQHHRSTPRSHTLGLSPHSSRIGKRGGKQ
jgi:hypothetical protein